MHFWMKTEFIKIGDRFNVVTDKINEYTCNQILFEVPINIDGSMRPWLIKDFVEILKDFDIVNINNIK